MTGVILFRAQPFHNGHLHMIKQACKDIYQTNGALYILVGSADKVGTKRNPIPIDLRISMIEESLKEALTEEEYSHVFICLLADLADEANNTHSWGDYLYKAMCAVSGDKDFLLYYSDNPNIILSWFDDRVREHIAFKFLPRYDNICATKVRECIEKDYRATLSTIVPAPVYNRRELLKKYIEEGK